ncbi:hypothetical protein ACF2JD_16515 [Aeromonas sp. A-5]|uniref:hypothetical protein n=1 Tax=Aeromonas ichthyocola TaxID=3367746 RepID=UPI0038E5AB32
MSKSCCSIQHAAPIKAVSKAASGQSEHHHDSHCCDNAARPSVTVQPRRLMSTHPVTSMNPRG